MRSSIVLVLLVVSSNAFAFIEASQFFAPAGGGHSATLGANAEGIYFTGSPRYSGLDCSTCHTDGPQRLTLKLGADDVDLFTSGYQPGKTYEFDVSLRNESAGLAYSTPGCTDPPGKGDTYSYQQCNNNNFALEIDDGNGPLGGMGVFCGAPPGTACPKADLNADEVAIAPGGDAVFANHAHSVSMPYQHARNDEVTWHFWWTAPAPGRGPLTVHVAAVDGNGGSGTASNDQDPYGDDTVHAAITIDQRDAQGGLEGSAGCAIAGDSHGAAPVLLSVLGAFVALLRRRKRVA